MPTKKETLDLLWDNPIELGHWVGFRDFNELHNEWLKLFLYSDHDITLQAHRGSFKTTTLSLFFAIHTIVRPDETVMFFRKTDTDVRTVIQTTSNILKRGCFDALTQSLYGVNLKLVKDTNTEIKTNLSHLTAADSQLTGLGIGTSITGKHADIICTDDIVNLDDRQSQAKREETKRRYMELENIKNRGGRFINTGTPWHKDDCFTLMPEPLKYDWRSTGLISEEQAAVLKQKMTNSLFAANYELRHVAEDDVIFTNPQLGAENNLIYYGESHVDAAFYGEDWTAFTIVAIHDGKFYVFGKCWRKHIDDVMDEVVGLHNNFLCKRLYIETNSDKGYVARALRNKGVRVSSYHESENKYIKITSYLKFNWKDVIFVRGTDDKYIEQIVDYNEHAEHDDCPDSLASLIRKLERKKNRVYEDVSGFTAYS